MPRARRWHWCHLIQLKLCKASKRIFGDAFTPRKLAVELSEVESGFSGFVINGAANNVLSGVSVASAGDVNGDGFDDVIVGSISVTRYGYKLSEVYLVFGKSDGTAVNLDDINAGEGGFLINEISEDDHLGDAVSGAGDVDGDGFDDLVVGADFDVPNGDQSGASFVIFGGNFSGAVTKVGTMADDVLSGTVEDDVIFAGTGDDILTSSAGVDRLPGGDGADTFVLQNVNGQTTVIDFVRAEGDQLGICALGFTDFATLQSATLPDGSRGGA